jgi:protein TonB
MTVMDATPPILLATDSNFRESRERDARYGRLRRGAIVAAALAHGVILAALLFDWPFTFAPPVHETPPISVALVTEPAPEPPQAKPEPTPPVFHELHSGSDQETTVLPPAQVKGPDAAPKPRPEQDQPQAAGPRGVQLKPEPVPPRKVQEAEQETAAVIAGHSSVNIVIGEALKEGDPYLNHLLALVEQHRFYPAGAIGANGKHLAGTTIYHISVAPSGAVEGTRLYASSGSDTIDEAAYKMIMQTAPFPPLPSYIPRNGVVIAFSVTVFPSTP